MLSQKNEVNWTKKTSHLHILIVTTYICANISAMISAIVINELGGDFSGFTAPSAWVSFTLGVLVSLSILLVMFPLQRMFERASCLRVLKIDNQRPSRKLSILVFTIQAIFLTYFVIYDAGTAGVISKNESVLKYFFYIISADFITLFYISSFSFRSKYVVANTVLFALSNIARGWAGVYLYLAWILLTKLAFVDKLTFRKWCLLIAVAFFLLPTAIFFKNFLRLGDSASFSFFELLGSPVFSFSMLIDIYTNAFFQLVDRLQHFSSIAVILEFREKILDSVNSGFIRIFFLDGIIGLASREIFNMSEGYDLGTSIVILLLGTNPLVSGYATHTGILGWLIVAPQFTLFYIFYLLILMFISIRLVKYCDSRGVRELNWLAWLLFIVHGWFGVFISYLISGFVFGYFRRRFCSLQSKYR